MKVNKINFLNFDNLYSIIVEKSIDNNYSNIKFGRNYPQLINHISVSLELSEVTQFEYIFLKMYSSSITKLYNQEFNLEFLENTYSKVYEKGIYNFLLFLSSVNDEIKDIDFDSYLSPSGIITGECSVTFTGSNLVSLISLEPSTFFVEASKGKCLLQDEDGNVTNNFDISYKDRIYTDEDFKNYFISIFIKKVYKYIYDKITYIDLASDSFNYQKFLSNVDNYNASFDVLVNPTFSINFKEDDLDSITKNIGYYKQTHYYSDKDFTLKNTCFEISLCTEFGVFFELFSILPFSRFISNESFNLPFNCILSGSSNIPECLEELKSKFENRYYGRINNLIEIIRKEYCNSEDSIKRFELTPNYSLFRYSLILSFDDINNYLYEYLECNEDSSDYIKKSTIRYINKILEFFKNFYLYLK